MNRPVETSEATPWQLYAEYLEQRIKHENPEPLSRPISPPGESASDWQLWAEHLEYLMAPARIIGPYSVGDHIAELTRINEELHAEVRTLKFKVQTLTNDLDNAIKGQADIWDAGFQVCWLFDNGKTLSTQNPYRLQTFAKQESNITIDTEDGA